MRELNKGLEELTEVEQVVWTAVGAGGRVDMGMERSSRSAAKIQLALDSGAIDGLGYVTAFGREVYESIHVPVGEEVESDPEEAE